MVGYQIIQTLLDKFITALIISTMEMRLITTFNFENVTGEASFRKGKSIRKIASYFHFLVDRWKRFIVLQNDYCC
jgi:hypothetical protein